MDVQRGAAFRAARACTPPRLGVAAAAALALLAAPGCGGSGGDAPWRQPSEKVTVVITDDAYRPAHTRVEVGQRVTFFGGTRRPATAETANVGVFETDRVRLDRENEFDIHTIRLGEAESVAFDTPGLYEYYSSFDSDVRGVVEVVDPR